MVTLPAHLEHLAQRPPRRLLRRPLRRPPHVPPPHGPPTGTTQRTTYGGASLAITVQQLIDPLRDSGAALLPGSRAVGIVVELVNSGPSLYDSSATGDFSLLASRGPVTPVFVPGGVCKTPLEDFDRYMTTGAVRSGCVAFSVPSAARVLAVRFSPHDQPAGRLTWSVASGVRRDSKRAGAR